MKLARASVHAGSQPVPGAFRAAGTPARRRVAIVRLESGDGCWGQGECSPLPGHSPDGADAAIAELRECAARLETRSIVPGALAAAIAGDLDDLLPRASSARFALETALFDLAGRASGRPLNAVLGGAGDILDLPVNVLLPPLTEPAAVVAAARDALARGVTTFKAKIARAAEADELAALDALRAELGPSIALRLDANRAWTLREAPARLARFAPVEPEYVEQPVGRDELFELNDAPVPLAADESMQQSGALERLRRVAAVSTVVLKPATCGGLVRARDLAERAARAGLAVVVTHLGDGPVGFAAAAELALSLTAAPRACGLAVHPGLSAWASVPPQAGEATVRAVAAPGLGLPPLEPPA